MNILGVKPPCKWRCCKHQPWNISAWFSHPHKNALMRFPMLIPSDEIQNGQNGGFRGLGDVQSI